MFDRPKSTVGCSAKWKKKKKEEEEEEKKKKKKKKKSHSTRVYYVMKITHIHQVTSRLKVFLFTLPSHILHLNKNNGIITALRAT